MLRSAGVRIILTGLCIGGTSSVQAQDFVTRDSAGVTIAVSRAPAWNAGEEWVLSSAPVLRIGEPMGDGELWQVRDFLRTPDGGAAVLSAGHSEVRIFDSQGRMIRSLGRSGSGPGEFEWPSAMALAHPDTLLVLDRGAIEIFLLDGTVLSPISVRPAPNAFGSGRSANPVAVAPDRSLIAAVHSRTLRPTGPFRPIQGLGYLPSPDAAPLFGGDYLGALQESVDIGGGQRTIVMPPFARYTTFGVGPTREARFFAADNDRYEVHVFSADGALSRIIRREVAPVRVRADWVEDWKARQRDMSWAAQQLPQLERAWQRMTVPETLPAFDMVAFDSEGYLWVARPTPVPDDPAVYDVFDPEGRYLGEVAAPFGVQTYMPPKIGPDYFMVLAIGGLGVEQVRVYQLNRTP